MSFRTWRNAANRVLASLFEPPCAACRSPLSAPLDGSVCDGCWAAVGTAPAIHECFDGSHAISSIVAVGVYEGRMKDIVHALKYDRRRSISPRLGALMRVRGAELLRDADCVVPVPLHPRREYSRGFNQAHDLAAHLGLPVLPLLKRVVHTQSQIELPKQQRLVNVHDAFAADPGSRISAFAAGWPLRRDLAGARSASVGGPVPGVVVLVDDVSTTGATLDACARVLKSAGVKDVRALTAARVVNARR